MKYAGVSVLFTINIPLAQSFANGPRLFVRQSTSRILDSSLKMSVDEETRKAIDMSGNNWKPTEGQMFATDVGDFFPEGYVDELSFTNGIKGISGLSHPKVNGGKPLNYKEGNEIGEKKKKPDMPGMEYTDEDYLEKDVIDHALYGGIEQCDPYTEQCVPEGMEFIPASAPDGSIEMNVPITSSGEKYVLEIKPFCMGYEDFYVGFAVGSHASFVVSPNAGRMDHRGGESTFLEIICDPRGKLSNENVWEGTMVVNIPEDGSKLTYKLKANILS